MKKYNIYSSFFILFSFLFLSCDDNLDIEPQQSLTPEVALGTAANIQNVLVGAYDLAGENDLFSGGYQLASELLSNTGELAWRGTFAGPAEFNRKEVTTSNGFVSAYWIFSYAVSNQTNLVLENLDKFDDEDEQARVEGEAKFLRAAVYFDLVRFFALPYNPSGTNSQMGVPIITVGIREPSQITFPSRNSVEEVYTFVISDLTDAIDLLPQNNSFFADKAAAQALLARVYLQQGNFEGARDMANEVIENSGHNLTGDFAGAFNNGSNSTEDIFAWQITTQDGINDMNTFWASRAFGGRSNTGDVTVETPYFSVFDNQTEDRRAFFYSGNSTLLTTKWQDQFANIPYLRLAEMYLIRAEANFRLNTAVGNTPLEDINILRERANAGPLNAVTLEDILLERRRELAFEGFRLHDIKRLQLSVDDLAYNSNQLVLPIPQREIDANPELEQNPGFSN